MKDMAAFVVPKPAHISDDDSSQTVCKVMSQVGNVAEVVSESPLDNVITKRELERIEIKNKSTSLLNIFQVQFN